MDTNSTGFVEKRTGYQGYKGGLPLRIEGCSVSGGMASFDFNSDINLLLTTSSPIVVYGELLQEGTGTIAVTSGSTTITGTGTLFTTELSVGSVLYVTDTGESQVVESISTDTSAIVGAAFSTTDASTAFTHRTTKEYYWTSFTNDSRKTIDANTSASFNVTHGAGTVQIASGVVTAPTSGSLDNNTIIPEDITIDSTTNLSVTMDNTGSSSDVDFYVLTENTDDTSVVTYRAAVSETLTAGAMTITIPAATHGLPNLHVLPFLYSEKVAGDMSIVIPDNVTVDSSGDIIIEVLNATGSIGGAVTFEGQIVLIDVPGTQALESSYTSGDGKTLEFEDVTSTFNFYSFFDQPGGGDQVQVIPDSIFYDASLNKVTVTFDIDTSRNLKLVYTGASVKSNVITVDMTDYALVINDSTPSVSFIRMQSQKDPGQTASRSTAPRVIIN